MSRRTEAVKRQMNQKERGFGGASYFNTKYLDETGRKIYKAQAGTHFLAIIPPPDEDSYFAQQIFAHYNVGLSNQAFLCPRMMNDDPCPLCEESMRIKRSGEEVDEATMKSLNPFPPRYLFWIVNMATAESEAQGVQLYDAPMTVNDEILALSKDRRTGELIDVSDPVDGKIVAFERVGAGLITKYRGFALEDRDPLMESWLDQAVDFDKVFVVSSYADIKKAWEGVDTSDDDDDVEPEPETREVPRRLAGRRRQRVVEPEEVDDVLPEEDWGGEEEAEEVEEEAPTARKETSVKEVLEDIGDELSEDDALAEKKERLREKMRQRRASKESE